MSSHFCDEPNTGLWDPTWHLRLRLLFRSPDQPLLPLQIHSSQAILLVRFEPGWEFSVGRLRLLKKKLIRGGNIDPVPQFETGHVLGVLLASSPLLEQAWTHCLRANAGSASFVIDKSDDAVFIAFSRAQAAASPSGLGRGFFEPVSLYSITHKLFALLGRGEEDSGGKPQPVLLQAPYEEEAQCAALCKSDKVCLETIMHLTCMNMPVEKIDHALNTIKANGIQNVLALKGDPPHGQDKFVQVAGGFACALDLVQHIRAKYGDYFGITVAGYPKAHPDMIQGDEGATLEAYNSDLAYLKRKTLSVVLKFWKSFSHVKILELCEIFIFWSANS
ncbi:hypothetical protein ZIOFF_028552 [Zingiber officinale]|uniref:Methylenetetrahydrofolate reductase n=1 Tax=Zingiber officinale TaxID=94328 RepID=A0A8J5GN86_ZINOF|nr:hypothetical protein ZIOFF_028552 [Zingiber officinale]